MAATCRLLTNRQIDPDRQNLPNLRDSWLARGINLPRISGLGAARPVRSAGAARHDSPSEDGWKTAGRSASGTAILATTSMAWPDRSLPRWPAVQRRGTIPRSPTETDTFERRDAD